MAGNTLLIQDVLNQASETLNYIARAEDQTNEASSSSTIEQIYATVQKIKGENNSIRANSSGLVSKGSSIAREIQNNAVLASNIISEILGTSDITKAKQLLGSLREAFRQIRYHTQKVWDENHLLQNQPGVFMNLFGGGTHIK